MQFQGELWASELYESTMRRRLLPVRLAPIEGESLSSWVVRLADAHGMSVQALGGWLMGRGRQAFGEDMDRGSWVEFMETLAGATERAFLDVQATTLKSFDGRLWGSLVKNGPARWVLPVGKVGTFRTAYGVQFCADCLANDQRPYFRLKWRLAFHVCCPVHHRLLSDRCGRCAAPVAAHRWRTGQMRRLGTTGIVRCDACGADRLGVDTRIDVPADLERIQEEMHSAVECGWSARPELRLHSLAYFSGSAVLWSLLDDERAASQLRKVFGLASPPTTTTSAQRYGSFERHDVRYRAWILDGYAKLMSGGVESLFEALGSCGFRANEMLRYGATLSTAAPYWIWRATRENLDHSFYVPSDEEIHNAISYYLKTSGRMNARVGDICQLLGMKTRSSARVASLMRAKGLIARRYSVGRDELGMQKTAAVA